MADYKTYKFGTEYWQDQFEGFKATMPPAMHSAFDRWATQITRAMDVLESRIPCRRQGEKIRERDRATFEIQVDHGAPETIAGWDALMARFPNCREQTFRQKFSNGRGTFEIAIRKGLKLHDFRITRVDEWRRRGPGSGSGRRQMIADYVEP